ncbi:MAG TPA: hypothetical protein VGG48_03490 [Rhizomicrobium sp.]|jgi:hypothetical protein
MANKRRAKAAARPAVRQQMLELVDSLETQLRVASHLTFVLCMIDPRPNEEFDAVIYQAMEIHDRLETATALQRRLFRLAQASQST